MSAVVYQQKLFKKKEHRKKHLKKNKTLMLAQVCVAEKIFPPN